MHKVIHSKLLISRPRNLARGVRHVSCQKSQGMMRRVLWCPALCGSMPIPTASPWQIYLHGPFLNHSRVSASSAACSSNSSCLSHQRAWNQSMWSFMASWCCAHSTAVINGPWSTSTASQRSRSSLPRSHSSCSICARMSGVAASSIVGIMSFIMRILYLSFLNKSMPFLN